jgi:glucose-6-phosphate-specific signal transduction histidine kinase
MRADFFLQCLSFFRLFGIRSSGGGRDTWPRRDTSQVDAEKTAVSGRFAWLEWELRLKANGIALTAAYATGYVLLRLISVDQWYLPAGLRVAALLLFSYRYWPYLIAGEFAAFAYLRYPLIDKYGIVWAIAASASLMPAVAALVYSHRRWLSAERVYGFLSVALLAAITVSAINLVGISFLMHPVKEPMSAEIIARQIVGQYLGILTLAPLALLWKQRRLAHPFPRRLRWDAVASYAAIAAMCAGVIWLPDANVEQKNFLRVLMVVPAVALTFLHGWRGAAIGVIGVNVGIRLTMQRTGAFGSDPNAFITQEILTIAATALLGFGAALSHYHQKARKHDLAEKHALNMARLSFVSSERELHERVAQIKAASGQMDETFQTLARWLREQGHAAAAMDVLRSGVLQTRLFRDQLNLVFPAEIEQYGLYGALDTEAIDAVWAQRAQVSRRLLGDPYPLSLGLQLAAYRSVCDGVALLSDCGHTRILLRLRCGRSRSRCGVAIRIASLDGALKLESAAGNFALDALEARVRAYGGLLHRRGSSIDLLMDEPIGAADIYGVPTLGFATVQNDVAASA